MCHVVLWLVHYIRLAQTPITTQLDFQDFKARHSITTLNTLDLAGDGCELLRGSLPESGFEIEIQNFSRSTFSPHLVVIIHSVYMTQST